MGLGSAFSPSAAKASGAASNAAAVEADRCNRRRRDGVERAMFGGVFMDSSFMQGIRIELRRVAKRILKHSHHPTPPRITRTPQTPQSHYPPNPTLHSHTALLIYSKYYKIYNTIILSAISVSNFNKISNSPNFPLAQSSPYVRIQADRQFFNQGEKCPQSPYRPKTPPALFLNSQRQIRSPIPPPIHSPIATQNPPLKSQISDSKSPKPPPAPAPKKANPAPPKTPPNTTSPPPTPRPIYSKTPPIKSPNENS